ncbi:unnamed protein product [Knipowitschia caucasica]
MCMPKLILGNTKMKKELRRAKVQRRHVKIQ